MNNYLVINVLYLLILYLTSYTIKSIYIFSKCCKFPYIVLLFIDTLEYHINFYNFLFDKDEY